MFDSYVKARIACLVESNYKDVTNPGAVDYYYNVVSEWGWSALVDGVSCEVGGVRLGAEGDGVRWL